MSQTPLPYPTYVHEGLECWLVPKTDMNPAAYRQVVEALRGMIDYFGTLEDNELMHPDAVNASKNARQALALALEIGVAYLCVVHPLAEVQQRLNVLLVVQMKRAVLIPLDAGMMAPGGSTFPVYLGGPDQFLLEFVQWSTNGERFFSKLVNFFTKILDYLFQFAHIHAASFS